MEQSSIPLLTVEDKNDRIDPVGENRRLRELILAMADRLEICSRLLGKHAERRACKKCEGEKRDGLSGVFEHAGLD